MYTKEELYLRMKMAEGASSYGIKTAEYAIKKFSGIELTTIGIKEWTISQLDKGMKPITVNHYLKHIRAYCNWLTEEFDEPKVKIKLVKQTEAKPKVFSEGDLAKLLVKPTKDDGYSTWRTWAIVNFILATGCRARTLINVRVDDIQDGNVIFRETKNKKMQILPISPSLQIVLAKYMKLCINNVYLFSCKDGTQLTYNCLATSFERYCTSRGVKQHNIHGLRHSFASIAVKAGMGTFELQKWLGHSDISITQGYVHLLSSDLTITKNPLEQLKKSR